MHAQRGTALFLILIAVALFAALSYAMTSSTRGSGRGVEWEKARLTAQRFISFGDGVRRAVMRMRIAGAEISDLNFDPAATGKYAVFSEEGGGALFSPPPPEADAQNDAYVWNFYKPSEGWSSPGVGTSAPELFIWIVGLDENVCKAINSIMQHPPEIIDDTNGDQVMEAYPGEQAYCYRHSSGTPQFIYVLEAG